MKTIKPTGWGIIAVLLTLVLLFTWASAKAATTSAPMQVMQVQPGDTLWSIARQAGGQQQDVRQVIQEIREMNELGEALIQPGQKLLVPVYD